MGITKIQDVIQPEVFTDYVINRTMEKSALVQSGIIENNSEFDALASGPNTIVNMPFWNDLTGDAETLTEDGKFSPKNITSGKDISRKLAFGNMWAVNNFAALLSGDDPMGAIADLVANYWVRENQKQLIATLEGIFSSSSLVNNIHDISTLTGVSSELSGRTFIDATQKLGDAKDLLTGVMMHSAVESELKKQDLIDYDTVADKSSRVGYYLDKRVIVDDSMPYNTATNTGTMYLFGNGAIAKGNGSHPDIVQTEFDRDKQSHAGVDYLINRTVGILHPRGIKWTETNVAKEFPNYSELRDGTNWELVYDPKQIRIVKFNFKISDTV